jgi:hypothetical protein
MNPHVIAKYAKSANGTYSIPTFHWNGFNHYNYTPKTQIEIQVH